MAGPALAGAVAGDPLPPGACHPAGADAVPAPSGPSGQLLPRAGAHPPGRGRLGQRAALRSGHVRPRRGAAAGAPAGRDRLRGLPRLLSVEDSGALEELLTFLGASYFRAVARDTRFGISARGLALETGLGKPEEFPAFTHFWMLRPSDPRDPLQICALLDSPSVAGAYRFDVAPRDGDGGGGRRQPVLPRRRLAGRHRAADQHVLLRRQRPGRRRRLSRRGPQFRRAVDLAGDRRGAVAAAGQPDRAAGQRVRRREPARLRPAAARARPRRPMAISTPASTGGRTCGSSPRAPGARARCA